MHADIHYQQHVVNAAKEVVPACTSSMRHKFIKNVKLFGIVIKCTHEGGEAVNGKLPILARWLAVINKHDTMCFEPSEDAQAPSETLT